METQTDPWQCPFCEPPVYTIKLPSTESQFLMNLFRKQISEHLQIHKQDVIKAIGEREKHRAATKVSGRSFPILEIINLFNI